MRSLDCDVAIVGGAVAGSALACNLRDTALRVIVLEAAPQILPVNRGDALAPCTVARLASWGALPSFEKRGAIRVTQWEALGPEGERLLHVKIAATAPEPYNYILCLPHPLLEAALIETALNRGSVSFMRGTRVSALLRNNAGRVVGVRAVTAGEPLEVRARLVVGCDGAGSLVRQQAGITTSIHTYPYQYVMLTCMRSPDQPADQNTEVWGAKGFCGLYPITAQHVRCPVQAAPGELARWREIGLEQVFSQMRARFPYFDRMTPTGTDLHVYKTLRHHADSYIADGLVLLGDAAHCTPPYYGMGMTMAMRDGHHLTRLIVPMLERGALPNRDDLAPFEERCRTFNEFVIRASSEYGDIGAAHLCTSADVQQHLAASTVLDPDVMTAIYQDYDAPSPIDPQPARLSKRSMAALQ